MLSLLGGFLIFLILSVGISASYNPYQRDVLNLYAKEPNSGLYTKNEAASVEEHWLSQKVNNFDKQDNRTWQMRYLLNAKYLKPNGPIYIFVGGEWSISPGLLSTGLTHDMAVENGGMLFYTEHRYYGQSWPLGNASLGIEQLKYLSLPQALADLAHFIEYQKAQNSYLRQSKVILVGGSYSGSMVTWMTRLYPQLIAASWASSAPLLAKADFYEYMEMVSQSIDLSYGRNCSQRIEKGLGRLRALFEENEIGKYLKRLNACESFKSENPLDRAAFFNGISNYFALVVQSYSSHIPNLCENLMSLDSRDEEAFLAFWELTHADDRRKSSNCQDFGYEAMLKLFTEQSLSDYLAISGVRAWFYQTCNEFGWYTTTTSSAFAREVPLSYFENLCRDAFGPAQTPEKLARGIEDINRKFGGNNFNHSQEYRDVIFTHGQLDPWSALGQRKGKSALIIEGYSHCQDLTSINIHDSVEMNLAKLRVMSFLRRHI